MRNDRERVRWSGSRDGPRGLGSRRFGFGTEPCGGAQRPGKGTRGELDGGGGPPRRGPVERKAGPEGRPGKAGRSRPHQGWGFRVMEVQEIVVSKDVVEVWKGGREARCKPRRPNTTGRWGCPSVPLKLPLSSPSEALFLLHCFENFKVACRGTVTLSLVSPELDEKQPESAQRLCFGAGVEHLL